jgi:hypothetical protein
VMYFMYHYVSDFLPFQLIRAFGTLRNDGTGVERESIGAWGIRTVLVA